MFDRDEYFRLASKFYFLDLGAIISLEKEAVLVSFTKPTELSFGLPEISDFRKIPIGFPTCSRLVPILRTTGQLESDTTKARENEELPSVSFGLDSKSKSFCDCGLCCWCNRWLIGDGLPLARSSTTEHWMEYTSSKRDSSAHRHHLTTNPGMTYLRKLHVPSKVN